MSSNIKAHHKLHLKVIVTFMEGYRSKLYYTQHILLSNVQQLSFIYLLLLF